MKPGREYEHFIFDKFKVLFANYTLTLNDKIIGKQSGIKREIDISIKGIIQNFDVLFLVQCKDHNRPADINIIGEFSSVIKDLGAQKGYLICKSGFAKTIHQYAKTVGIELITVEDINSEKWTTQIELPINYIYKTFEINTSITYEPSDELIEKYKSDLYITEKDVKFISFDKGNTSIELISYLNSFIEENNYDFPLGKSEIELNNPNLMLYFAGIWTKCKLKFVFELGLRHYLKFIPFDEYCQLTDHLLKKIIPINFSVNFNPRLDESYVEIQENEIPVSSLLRMEVEENIRPIKSLNFDFVGLKQA